MNYRKALYYACTGRTFDGKEAETMGLVTYSVSLAELRNEVIRLAGSGFTHPGGWAFETSILLYSSSGRTLT